MSDFDDIAGSLKRYVSTWVSSRTTNPANSDTTAYLNTCIPSSKVYIRNGDCWARDLDLSGMSVGVTGYSSGGTPGTATGLDGVTMVSDTYFIGAAHTAGSYSVGAQVDFLGNDGNVYTRTIIALLAHLAPSHIVTSPADTTILAAGSQAWDDLMVGKLSAALPAAVKPLKILPANWRTYLPMLGLNLPILHWGKWDGVSYFHDIFITPGRFLSYQTAFADPEAMWTFPQISPPDYRRDVVHGDSGGASFIPINGEAVLISTNGWGDGTYAPALDGYRDWVDAAIATLSAL